MKETSFVYQGKRGFFLHFGQKPSGYGQNNEESSAGAAMRLLRSPIFAFPGQNSWCTFVCSLRLQRTTKRVKEVGFEPTSRQKQLFGHTQLVTDLTNQRKYVLLYAHCDRDVTTKQIPYNHSLCLIFQALLETVQEFFHVSDEQMDAFVFCFIGKLPKQLQQSLCIELDAACCA